MKTHHVRVRGGFTLIEILLVIGIIAALTSIVIYALSPAKQLADARDAQRRSDVSTIINAVFQYTIDNAGTPLTSITPTAKEICISGAGSAMCDVTAIDLDVLTGSYIVRMPQDPTFSSSATGTSYFIERDATTGRITVTATRTERQPTDISITR